MDSEEEEHVRLVAEEYKHIAEEMRLNAEAKYQASLKAEEEARLSE